MTSNHGDMPQEMGWMRRLAAETGRPVSFNLVQVDPAPDLWRGLLREAEAAAASGAQVVPQVAGRPAGVLMGWETTAHPFLPVPSYFQLLPLPFSERLERLRDPEVRRRILEDEPIALGEFEQSIVSGFHKMFPLGADVPDYEPEPSESVAAIAQRTGRPPLEVAYDLMLERDGTGLLYFPMFNYSNGDMEPLRDMLQHPLSNLGLGDGGAHCGVICDASIPTYMLTHWARDRTRGPRLPLETIVKKQTRDTATLYGLTDRGLVAAGLRADLNIIDFERLRLFLPRAAYDLPAGGRRLIQKAAGYRATVKSGQVTWEHGESTGALPGGLLRGPQRALALSALH